MYMDVREAEQRAPLQRIWDGMIPIELQLAASDAIELLASAVLPEPFQTFYMLIPRVSYFPFVTSKIKERWLDPMFALSGNNTRNNNNDVIKEHELWFEYRGQALKWHYPVGLLYDMLVSDVAKGQPELPWSLTLHVRKFPTTKLVPGPSVQSMKDMFMAMIKESDFIRNGSTKRVMDLAKSDQMQFLEGLETHSFEKYYAIHSIIVPLMDPRSLGVPRTSSGNISGGSRSQPKAIPLKFYMETKGAQEDSGNVATTNERTMTAAVGANAKQADIGMFHVSQFPVPLNKDGQSDSANTVADAFKLCYEIADQSGDAFVSNCLCLSQGIAVPWETPISWLAENLYYADCFLHLVVVSA
ncbi:autophagy protein 5 [Coemansia sp. RSA 1722]|nr:autophagy protein 5 [Coemansia sp. RSA 486]KAJ2594633.1 autophagy protein 5 [Coemansia sp. RSA 1721]KAJ2605168.1 autophagy protein 5 [Coemansia sp. RSA 1722]KAJ2638652.1 autophagy protein 5 [Coemansia sp. RSA 1286]